MEQFCKVSGIALLLYSEENEAWLPAQITNNLASPSRMSHKNCIFQVQRFEQCREIVGIRIHLMAVPRLA